MVQVFVAKMSHGPILSGKWILADAARIYTASAGVGEFGKQHQQGRSTIVRVSRLHFLHTPPIRFSELVKDHARLANGPHWVAASVVRVMLTMSRTLLEGGAGGEHERGGIRV